MARVYSPENGIREKAASVGMLPSFFCVSNRNPGSSGERVI